jgi:hypothetical protein
VTPFDTDKDAAMFSSKNRTVFGAAESIVEITIFPVTTLSNYSFPNAAANKSKIPHDFVLHSIESMKYTSLSDSGDVPVKNMPVTVGVNHYPAWRLDYNYNTLIDFYTSEEKKMYGIDIYTVLGDRVFKFHFIYDAILTSNYIPIFQKMIDSFQLNS